MESDNFKNAIADETFRIEEDALHSMKTHFHAGSTWRCVHLILGLPGAFLTACTGVEAFPDEPQLADHKALAHFYLKSIWKK